MVLPSLKFLRAFQIAAKLGSFSAAAEELCVTPSAVSHLIKALETQLGVALFERAMRTLRLTEAGARYLEHINGMFAKLERITEQVRAHYGRSVVRLNVPPFFANELLLPHFSSLSSKRRGTDIRIETSLSSPKTHPPEADLSVVVGTGPWDGFTVHPLFAQGFSAACSSVFLLKHPIRSYADLNGKTLLVHEGRLDAWDRWAMGVGIPPIRPNHQVRLGTMAEVVLAAERGIGVALVASRLSADRFTAGGLVKLFEAELATNESYVLLQRPEDESRPDLKEFTQWIIQNCREGVDALKMSAAH